MQETVHGRQDPVFDDIGKTDKPFRIKDGEETHNTGYNRAQYGSQSRAVDAQGRETEMPVDQ